MGPKRRNLLQPRTAADSGAPPNQEQSNKDLIELECKRAILPLRRNNYSKALRLIRETCLRYPNSALTHRMQAHAHMRAASLMAAGPTKQRHLQDALNSVRQAVALSPKSIITMQFYVTILVELATDAQGYEEIVRECERALAIEDPIDPADEDNVHENLKKIPTAEERIEIFRVELRSQIQKSRAALTENIQDFSEEAPSSQDFSEEEPSFQDFSEEEASSQDFSEEEASSQDFSKEEEETTVQVKKMEELPKETETRLAALNPENSRTSKRKKLTFLKNIVSSAKKKTQAKAYWESITEDKKREFLELKIGDLRDHFRSLKDNSAVRTFSEAVDYADKNKTWKFWPCYLCNEKFAKVESRLKHIEKFHKKAIARDLRDYVPREIDPDWAKLLAHGMWKPVDIPGAMEIIRRQSKPELGSDQFSCEVPKKEDEVVDISKLEKISLPKACSDNHNWPLSDDMERAKLLESICGEFQLLVRRDYLSMKNLSELIRYTFDELQKFVPASGLRVYGLDRTPLCICFLCVSQLELVLRFLKHLSLVGDENKVPDTGSSSIDAVGDFKLGEQRERIVFPNEQLLQVEFMPCRYHDAASTCTIHDGEFDVLPDGDDLMHWLFDVPTKIGENLALWTMLQDSAKNFESMFFQTFEKDFKNFQRLNEVKCNLSSQMKALGDIETICNEELAKREQDTNHVPQRYVSLLQRWVEELVNADNDNTGLRRYHLTAIRSTLKESTSVEAVDIIQFKIEAASDHVDEEYMCIRTAILRQNEQLTSELDKNNEMLERTGLQLWKAGGTYKQTTSLDYRSIMLPLLTLFMQEKMEALVDEDARKKADAAVIAILSELELEAKKNTSKGGDPVKHPKKKNKKKNKKKAKDMKATRGDELNVVQEEKEEEPPFPAGPIVDFPCSENDVAVSTELKLLEEEERKLEAMLEHQRQIEDEAKQKILAKQMKNEAKSIPEIDVWTVPLNLEAGITASGSVMAHNDPSIGKSEMPVDFSGVPASTKSPKDSSSGSASQKNRSRSRSHGDVNQDKLPAQKNVTLTESQSVPSETPSEKEEEEDLRVLSSEVTFEKIRASDTLGPGMKNDHDEYNCFLNVIVQSFWHLRKFRDEFLSRSRSEHNSIGHPCVVCKLHEVLNGLSVASANMQRQAVSPSPLRIALSELNRDSITFREGQMNDASEVLEVILDRLHWSFSPGSGVSDVEPLGSQKCDSDACIAHKIFGMDIHKKLICNCCGTEPSQQKYTSCLYMLQARALRSVKVFKTTCAKTPFDELFKLVRKFHETFPCDPNAKRCNGYNIPCHLLSIRPHVFTLVLGWETASECIEHISATLEILDTEIDLGVMFDGLNPGHIHSLISMVCYSGMLYICFVYSHEHQQWNLYNDEIVKVIGSWDDVISECEKGHLQPTVLFFEYVE